MPVLLQSPRVYVSYVKENRGKVGRLVAALEAAGADVWWDQNRAECLPPGKRWKAAIRTGIETGSFFVACFSKEWAAKGTSYMNEELIIAVECLRKMPRDRVWFIPARLSECELPDHVIGPGENLRDLQWIDLFPDWDPGVQAIVNVVLPGGPLSLQLQAAQKLIATDVPSDRLKAVVLASTSSAHTVATSILHAGLRDPDPLVCRQTALALRYPSEPHVPALIALLRDADPHVRNTALAALSRASGVEPLVVYFRFLTEDALASTGESLHDTRDYPALCDRLEASLDALIMSATRGRCRVTEEDRNGESCGVRYALSRRDLDVVYSLPLAPWDIVEVLSWSEVYGEDPPMTYIQVVAENQRVHSQGEPVPKRNWTCPSCGSA